MVRFQVVPAGDGFLGLTLLKFGNPPIMEKFVAAPANIYELVLGYPWPISWAYLALGMVVYTAASRAVPAAELTLLSLIEVMLGPLWV